MIILFCSLRIAARRIPFITLGASHGVRLSSRPFIGDFQPPSCYTFPNPRRNSSSSMRWKNRRGKDIFTREARVQGLKSRAAFKLLEIDAKYKIFKRGQTVVDLGYAPGSWSQVAVERTKPNGRVLGIDIIPAQPPSGVSTIQGNFLSPKVQEEVKNFLSDLNRGRPYQRSIFSALDFELKESRGLHEQEYLMDMEQCSNVGRLSSSIVHIAKVDSQHIRQGREEKKTVDVILSDMSAPWEQVTGFWKRSLSLPYNRMMNTTGINFKDHAGSMDLCNATLNFSQDSLKVGGHLICKFYQGAEDKQLEMRLRELFYVVRREKPESSRSESKEAYFVALRRKNWGFNDGSEGRSAHD